MQAADLAAAGGAPAGNRVVSAGAAFAVEHRCGLVAGVERLERLPCDEGQVAEMRQGRRALPGEVGSEIRRSVGWVGGAWVSLAVLSALEIKARVFELSEALQTAGAHVYVPRGDQDYAIDVGLRMLTLRHLIDEQRWALHPAARGAAGPALLRQLDRAPAAG